MAFTTITSEYKVDRNLWESLEGIFQMHGLKYVSELAKRLQVDEKKLVRKVFGTDNKMYVTMVDSSVDSSCCQAYCKTAAIVHHCRKPVCIGSIFCSTHQILRPSIVENVTGLISIRKLADTPDREALWVKNDGEVIGIDGSNKGYYNQETGKLQLFIINNSQLKAKN